MLFEKSISVAMLWNFVYWYRWLTIVVSYRWFDNSCSTFDSSTFSMVVLDANGWLPILLDCLLPSIDLACFQFSNLGNYCFWHKKSLLLGIVVVFQTSISAIPESRRLSTGTYCWNSKFNGFHENFTWPLIFRWPKLPATIWSVVPLL